MTVAPFAIKQFGPVVLMISIGRVIADKFPTIAVCGSMARVAVRLVCCVCVFLVCRAV